MTPSGGYPDQSPAFRRRDVESGENEGSNEKIHSPQKGTADLTSPRDQPPIGSVSQGTPGSPASQTLHKEKSDSVGSRIPQRTGSRQASTLSSQKRSISEVRSSIPIYIQKPSAEQLGAKQSELPVRTLGKPRGPRPRPSAEQTVTVIYEPVEEMEQLSKPVCRSASTSSAGSWDFGDVEEPQRPPTVFTGEYRTRTLTSLGRQTSGPILRIASSAEELVMGKREPLSDADTQKTSPALGKYFDKFLPGTPKGSKSLQGTPMSRETPEHKNSISSSPESASTTRRYCRPPTSFDSLPKRDFSGKEISISRKPVTSLSLSRLFSPSLSSLRCGDEPLVPRIPDVYVLGQENATNGDPNGLNDPTVPAKVTPEGENTPFDPEAAVTPMPEAAIKASTTYPHPPRTSSLQALSEFSGNPDSQHGPTISVRTSSKVSTNLKRNVTFEDIVPGETIEDQPLQSGGARLKLPESRSTHLLGSFRNIFKSRGGAERAKKENNGSRQPMDENENPSAEYGIIKGTLIHSESAKCLKNKPKYSRLSGGVNWNKGLRNPKAADESPMTPTPSFPRLLAPPHRSDENNIPSFARTTKSTRTKAASVSTTPGTHPRGLRVRTASTGSPQRLDRRSRRTTGSFLIPSAQKRMISSPIAVCQAVPINSVRLTDGVPKNVDAVRTCLDTLCRRVGESTTPLGRDRHIRLALNLQQQLGDYQSVERAALEVEALAKERRLERRLAEETLNTSLAEVQAQLEED